MVAKYYWPFPSSGAAWRVWSVASRVICGTVVSASKLWLETGNKVKVHNFDLLRHHVFDRPSGTPLLTVCNHQSCIDDPLIWGPLLSWSDVLKRSDRIRWVAAASEICFFSRRHALFFGLGRCVPVARGDGIYQRPMDFLVDRLNLGDWVHTFPEGKINVTKEPMRLKWGVGRMVVDCRVPPTVIPLWHLGMDEVLPNRTPYLPHLSKEVTVNVGEPMLFDGVLRELRARGASPVEMRKVVTDLIEERFATLKAETEKLHAGFASQH